ncbi:hypothetical protein SAMN05660916_02418 [Arthrobacter sp. 31Cvi3.1E]|nr:hypothetical protein SAMN05660916_02418 [Arthrobacter sp. 31Cvi3.1E]
MVVPRHQHAQHKPESDWYRAPGESVDIRSGDQVLYQGRVDVAMPDGSGLWLAAQGTAERTYKHKEHGLDLCVED